ncbi:MAG: NAD(P)-dependent oxidoreductase [Thermobacillus sp.]|uniref:dTDP-4-dehydrorhamnose reductase family protein n=1 Tax=Thermobacillus sp. TaxID=2108467 RepID=UPI000E396FC2|nr:SDR family oxidoreductase [Thermobacillus sp.]REK55330.1 MAG: NAD(P)-dependent oxidoreductase [Thermobacillus sp.]
MKVLVIGGNGMAGHMMVRYFRKTGADVWYTVRRLSGGIGELKLDATDLDAAAETIGRVCPHLVINCVGVLNQDAERRPKEAYLVNGLLPHWLARAAEAVGGRLIHISSDCVFLGDRGGYRESDRPDGVSAYARTKALGEVHDPRHLTIRTSIIGPEIRPDGIGLLRWFLQQKGTVNGYARVLWNGVTTLELARAVEYAAGRPEIGGLVHLTAPRIVSKLELLGMFREAFGWDDVTIRPSDEPRIDRTLVRERTDFDYMPPDYPEMLAELADWMREG